MRRGARRFHGDPRHVGADDANRVAAVNPKQSHQQEPVVRGHHAVREFPPSKISQTDFVPGLVGQRDQRRQDYNRNEQAAKGPSHAQASVTAAVSECQE